MIRVFVLFAIVFILYIGITRLSMTYTWLISWIPYFKWGAIILGAAFALLLVIKIIKSIKK